MRWIVIATTRYPFYRRLCGLQGRFWGLRKTSPQLGFDPRTLHPSHSESLSRPVPHIRSRTKCLRKFIKPGKREILLHLFHSVTLILSGELGRIWKEAVRESNREWRQEARGSKYEPRNSGIETKNSTDSTATSIMLLGRKTVLYYRLCTYLFARKYKRLNTSKWIKLFFRSTDCLYQNVSDFILANFFNWVVIYQNVCDFILANFFNWIVIYCEY